MGKILVLILLFLINIRAGEFKGLVEGEEYNFKFFDYKQKIDVKRKLKLMSVDQDKFIVFTEDKKGNTVMITRKQLSFKYRIYIFKSDWNEYQERLKKNRKRKEMVKKRQSKNIDQTVAKTKNESSKLDPVYGLTEKEMKHIASMIETTTVKGKYLRQEGEILKTIVEYKHPSRAEILEKVTGIYIVKEGYIPETYPDEYLKDEMGNPIINTTSQAKLWRSRPDGIKNTYCTNYDLAFYHLVCQYYETVKKKFFKGKKPPSSTEKNYR